MNEMTCITMDENRVWSRVLTYSRVRALVSVKVPYDLVLEEKDAAPFEALLVGPPVDAVREASFDCGGFASAEAAEAFGKALGRRNLARVDVGCFPHVAAFLRSVGRPPAPLGKVSVCVNDTAKEMEHAPGALREAAARAELLVVRFGYFGDTNELSECVAAAFADGSVKIAGLYLSTANLTSQYDKLAQSFAPHLMEGASFQADSGAFIAEGALHALGSKVGSMVLDDAFVRVHDPVELSFPLLERLSMKRAKCLTSAVCRLVRAAPRLMNLDMEGAFSFVDLPVDGLVVAQCLAEKHCEVVRNFVVSRIPSDGSKAYYDALRGFTKLESASLPMHSLLVDAWHFVRDTPTVRDVDPCGGVVNMMLDAALKNKTRVPRVKGAEVFCDGVNAAREEVLAFQGSRLALKDGDRALATIILRFLLPPFPLP
jgi:hypothetical protein